MNRVRSPWRVSRFGATGVFAALLLVAQLPTELPSTKFSSGQDVQPYFEGWIRNGDGTFDLVFGYFNRNWQEELAIPPGPDNAVAVPGSKDSDHGQPTYFLPRRQGEHAASQGRGIEAEPGGHALLREQERARLEIFRVAAGGTHRDLVAGLEDRRGDVGLAAVHLEMSVIDKLARLRA